MYDITSLKDLQYCPERGLRSSRFDDLYYAANAGAEESAHVFIDGNRLSERFSQLFKDHQHAGESQSRQKSYFTIAETGFGTGLNFVVACKHWLSARANLSSAKAPCLYYFATERYPLTAPAMRWAWAQYNPLPDISAEFLTQYVNPHGAGQTLSLYGGSVKLCILYGSSDEALTQLPSYPVGCELDTLTVDAWFLDGFAPSVNPDMWQDTVMAHIGRLSVTGSTVATFSVARAVKDGLKQAGFALEKTPGFGKKREMLRGRMMTAAIDSASSQTTANVYYSRSSVQPTTTNKTVVVIGAGIAGCTVANSLASRGWKVDLIERGAHLAYAASGNTQVVLHQKATANRSELNDFHTLAVNYAYNRYIAMQSTLGADIGLQALLQLTDHCGKDHTRWPGAYQETLKTLELDELPYYWLSPQAASRVAGISLNQSAYCFHNGVWVNPSSLCRQLVQHSNIQLHLNTDVQELRSANNLDSSNTHGLKAWAVFTADKRVDCDKVVLACGNSSHLWPQTDQMPIKSLRGQVTLLPSTESLQGLQSIVCGDGFLLPAKSGRHLIGATYHHGSDCDGVSNADHQQNVAQLRALCPSVEALSDSAIAGLEGRASVRATTPDYLPLIGAVPNVEKYRQCYSDLRRNARRQMNTPPAYYDGLYITAAYGSRGFSGAWLGAELLSAEINGEPCPIPNSIRESVHPARFVIRQLKRDGKV